MRCDLLQGQHELVEDVMDPLIESRPVRVAVYVTAGLTGWEAPALLLLLTALDEPPPQPENPNTELIRSRHIKGTGRRRRIPGNKQKRSRPAAAGHSLARSAFVAGCIVSERYAERAAGAAAEQAVPDRKESVVKVTPCTASEGIK